MPELSRPLRLALVGDADTAERIVADDIERAGLAERFGIVAIERLEAELRLRTDADGAVRATGEMTATVVQSCVVTFEPVTQSVREPVDWRLLPAGRPPADGPDEPDEIETANGVADLGEALAEQLSLALDPYPRAAGAVLPELPGAAGEGAFGGLARLRTRG